MLNKLENVIKKPFICQLRNAKLCQSCFFLSLKFLLCGVIRMLWSNISDIFKKMTTTKIGKGGKPKSKQNAKQTCLNHKKMYRYVKNFVAKVPVPPAKIIKISGYKIEKIPLSWTKVNNLAPEHLLLALAKVTGSERAAEYCQWWLV